MKSDHPFKQTKNNHSSTVYSRDHRKAKNKTKQKNTKTIKKKKLQPELNH